MWTAELCTWQQFSHILFQNLHVACLRVIFYHTLLSAPCMCHASGVTHMWCSVPDKTCILTQGYTSVTGMPTPAVNQQQIFLTRSMPELYGELQPSKTHFLNDSETVFLLSRMARELFQILMQRKKKSSITTLSKI